MKTQLRHIGALLLVLVYGFAMGLATQASPVLENNLTDQQHEHFLAAFSQNFNHHLSTSDRSISIVSKGFETQSSYDFSFVFHHLFGFEKRILQLQNGYLATSLLFYIQQRKKDLIYPFHYFW